MMRQRHFKYVVVRNSVSDKMMFEYRIKEIREH